MRIPCATSKIVLAVLVIASAGTPAASQVTSRQESAVRANCRSDFMTHCHGTKPGKGVLICLQQNVDKLSPGCKSAVKATIPASPAAATPAASAPKS